MEYATLTKQNQITVPQKVRDKLLLKPSDKLVFYEYGSDIKVAKLKSIRDFEDLLKNQGVKFSKKDLDGVWLERYLKHESKNKK